MNAERDWFKIPISEFKDNLDGETEDYGFTGTTYVMNSESHKYFYVIDDHDKKIIESKNDAQRVSADAVTKDCHLLVSARTFVLNELEGNGLSKSKHGLGDMISAVLRAMGVRRSCCGCDSRRSRLNNLFQTRD